jgi:prolyl-tRNA editing enzyme YbaK/EbsC (Cys-tRNA(Pro) deacylase)
VEPRTLDLVIWLAKNGVAFEVIRHGSAGGSFEVAGQRAKVGYGDVVGAKALLCECSTGFIVAVIPGQCRLDSQAFRRLVGKFRFASPDEFSIATGGLMPGTLPPFGMPVIAGVGATWVDSSLKHASRIAFNAAALDRSIVLSSFEYQKAMAFCSQTNWTKGISKLN